MSKRRVPRPLGLEALSKYINLAPENIAEKALEPDFARAIIFLLEELAQISPGRSVEVRVPPLGATQCIDGPRHSRGTPPNVVEMSPETWFGLAIGRISWQEAMSSNLIRASGIRSSLAEFLPLEIKGLE